MTMSYELVYRSVFSALMIIILLIVVVGIMSIFFNRRQRYNIYLNYARDEVKKKYFFKRSVAFFLKKVLKEPHYYRTINAQLTHNNRTIHNL